MPSLSNCGLQGVNCLTIQKEKSVGDTSPNLKSQQPSFKKISTSDDWFEVHEIAGNLFVLCEPRHYENTIVNLVIGREKAALIDTGCGIGNLRSAIEDLTR